MKVTTLQYNVNQPIAQQIVVPTNSEYAIGLKIIKDGEPVELSASELSVDGQNCITTNAGYNVFKLSSDTTAGMKSLDVVVNKQGCDGISYMYDFPTPADTGYMVTFQAALHDLSVSDGSKLPEIITLDARRVSAHYEISGSIDGKVSGDLPVYPAGLMPISDATVYGVQVGDVPEDDGVPQLYFLGMKNGSMTWFNAGDMSLTDVGPVVSAHTTSASVMSVTKVMTEPQASQGSANISFATDIGATSGFNTNFKLQTLQKDMGYIEVIEH